MTSLSIADRAGISLAYDYRIHRPIQKAAKMCPSRPDYSGLLDTVHKEACVGAIRDFEPRTDTMKEAKEKEKATKEKERTNKNKTHEQKTDGEDTAENGRRARSDRAATGQTGANNKKHRTRQRTRRRRLKRTKSKRRKKWMRSNSTLLSFTPVVETTLNIPRA